MFDNKGQGLGYQSALCTDHRYGIKPFLDVFLEVLHFFEFDEDIEGAKEEEDVSSGDVKLQQLASFFLGFAE